MLKSHSDRLYDLPEDISDVMGLQALRPSVEVHAPRVRSTCPTCEKYIQVNLGKHVALYHLDLAQLWRRPVSWCTIWKGTSQDCVDHMRKAHNSPVFVKAGNLAQWFPPWTVTREQWHSMSRPSVSGIAIDTFLFSRIGMPLFHRYRVFDRQGSHPAFRGTYMAKLFDFLKETDAESICRSHRRRAKEITASMSQGVSASKKDQATNTSTRWTVQRISAPKIRGQEQVRTVTPVAEMRQKTAMSASQQRSVAEDTVQALMDLALPQFKKSDDRVTPKTRPWPVALSSPASPASVDGGNRIRSSSPCVDLDVLSSDDSEVDITPQDYRVTLLCNSDDSRTPVGSVQFSSEEDHSLSSGQDDRRKVRKRNNRPLCRSDSMDRPADEPAKVETSVDMENDSLMNKQLVDELPEWSDSELMPLIYLKDTSVVDMMDMTGCPLPKCCHLGLRQRWVLKTRGTCQLLCRLTAYRRAVLKDMPAEGSIFGVSPGLPGFNMRPAEVGLNSPDITQPPPSVHGGFNDSFFGAPITFAQCNKIKGWIRR